jgi:hypothetical protein
VGEAYAWSFWRLCGLLEVDGYCEVDVFAEVAALQIAGVAKNSLIDRGSSLGSEQPATDRSRARGRDRQQQQQCSITYDPRLS